MVDYGMNNVLEKGPENLCFKLDTYISRHAYISFSEGWPAYQRSVYANAIERLVGYSCSECFSPDEIQKVKLVQAAFKLVKTGSSKNLTIYQKVDPEWLSGFYKNLIALVGGSADEQQKKREKFMNDLDEFRKEPPVIAVDPRLVRIPNKY